MKNSKSIHVRQETVAAIRKLVLPVLEKMDKSDIPDNVVVDDIRKTLGDDLTKIKMNEDEVHYLDLIIAAIARGIAIKNVRAFVISRAEEYDAASAVSLPEDPVYEEAVVLLGERRLASPKKDESADEDTDSGEDELLKADESDDDRPESNESANESEESEIPDDMLILSERRLANPDISASDGDWIDQAIAEIEKITFTAQTTNTEVCAKITAILTSKNMSGNVSSAASSLAFDVLAGRFNPNSTRAILDYASSGLTHSQYIMMKHRKIS